MRDLALAGELDSPFHAVEVHGEVEGVDTARQCVVPREQEAAPGVVDRDCRTLMARGAGELQHATAAEVESDDLVRPGGEAEERLDGV